MTVTHYDVVEGRIALALLIGLLSLALFAHLVIGQPSSMMPALIALGGLMILTFQNVLIYLSQLGAGEEEEEAEGANAA
ncbi:hypothetical protein [Halolamina salifodinae]|uniref:Uncharacterized protein n=1 Tax=Halolamina salifodinae TaxID=1202767 RepID=A0A8T4GWF6_9EURY|nr:hypothetical protein [Halolamina salifodinae]MBP1987229.1 hypothetical protein [Halolamina salifodinae]